MEQVRLKMPEMSSCAQSPLVAWRATRKSTARRTACAAGHCACTRASTAQAVMTTWLSRREYCLVRQER